MRILLTSTASYVPPRGGSTRSNLAWLERLAEAGHTCEVVCSAAEQDTAEQRSRVRRELEEQQLPVEPERTEGGVEIRRYGGIPVHAVLEPAHRTQVLATAIKRFQPDWVLVSSEDLSHGLLREAERSASGRVVYLAHTPQFFPFGPESWSPDPGAAEVVARSAAVIAISRHVAGYIERHTGRSATVIHPPMYGDEPYPVYGSFDGGLITMVNPCAVKGISIFLELARAFPQFAFGALPGWGTTKADRTALAEQPNVAILPSVRNIDDVLSRSRVLLMPSLWFEGFGLITMEAMLRGVPVIASDSGGLVEAKSGTNFVIPIRPVERYDPMFDDRHMPRPVIPPQEIAPWRDALGNLLADREVYQREQNASRRAALQFVSAIRPNHLGEFLSTLEQPSSPAGSQAAGRDAALARLSPEKRALLLQRLKKTNPKAG
jgi:glycosyltransferase involved in cell wall biosynthesis